jgi:hypothetical protein
MLTESKIIDQITVGENNVVHIRESNVISRDGVEIARSYHRTTIVKGQDVSAWPQNVQDICAAAWRGRNDGF